MKKRLAELITAGVMATSMAMSASAEDIVFTRDCSQTEINSASDVWATLKSDGVLTVSGTGEMDFCKQLLVDYEAEGVSPYPWGDTTVDGYAKDVEKLIVEEGVTGICDFSMLMNIKSVYLPNSIEEVNAFDFILCPKLETLFLSPGTKSIYSTCFNKTAENFTIYGYKGTYAESYAAENAHNFHAMGDLNSDGSLDLSDAENILSTYAHYASGGDVVVDPESTAPDDADVNQDGTVDIADAALTVKYYAQTAAGLETDWSELLSN